MTIDNLQQPSGESLREATYTASYSFAYWWEAIALPVACAQNAIDQEWPWGGVSTTEEYRDAR